MTVLRRFTAPAVAVAISLALVGCANRANIAAAQFPTDYLQLRFAQSDSATIPSFTIGVGTKIAVLAIPGNQDPPGYPTSRDESVVRAASWPEPNTAPRNWYPFVAVNPGRTAIWESYPCSGTGCAAMMAQIVLTVVSTGQPNQSFPPSANFPPPPTLPPSANFPPSPTLPPLPAPQGPSSYPAAGYPTGDNVEVLAVTTGPSGRPVLTLLIPDMNCNAMYFGIPAMPAPSLGPCVVTFDSSNGNVGPAPDSAIDPGTDLNAACPAWPTPHVTFILDPRPPTSGCQLDQSLPTGLHPGAIGWLVEGGGLPYFALPDGTTIRPPAPHRAPRPNPSTAPTP